MRKSVLIVEDNPDSRKLFCDLLEVHGLRTDSATNGRDAVQMARQHRPDLILMDVRLQGALSGLDAAAELRREARFAELPIIAITALAMPGDRDRMMAAGFDDYLSKPVSISEILRMVGRFLGEPAVSNRPPSGPGVGQAA